MPVSEISKGVFIIAPRDLPKYKDTAAGQYTSVFTKQRADQWEMAQKQALMELELGTKRYAEEMKTYRDRLAALDERQKQLEKMKVDIAEGRLRAQDAAEIAALREAGDRQRTAADFAAKKAEVITKSEGSTTTRTGRGGGTKPTADVSTTAMGGISSYELATRGQNLDQKMGALARETNPGGTIITESESDRVNARGSVADRAAAARAAEIEKMGKSPADARVQAEAEVIASLKKADPTAAAEVEKYFDEVKPATAPTAGGGGTTTTVRPADTTTAKRPGLGPLPEAPAVERPEVALGQPTIQDINEYINNIEMAKLGLTAPTMGGMDYITRSREIMRGRFGGFSGAPEALPFEQRNAAAELVSNQAYGLSQIEAYRDFLAKQKAAAAAAAVPPAAPAPEVAPAVTPASLSPEQASLTRAAATDLLQSRRPSLLDDLVAPKTPQIPEIAALNIPRKPALTEPPAAASVPTPPPAPVTPPPPAPPIPEAEPVAPVDIRPEAAALMTPDEIAAFKERLQAAADAAQMRRDLAAADMGGAGISPEMIASVGRLTPPAALPSVARPQMTPPVGVAETIGRIPVPTPRPGFRPSIGQYTPGPVPAIPKEGPSTALAAPTEPAAAPAGYLQRQPSNKLPAQIALETKQMEEAAGRSARAAGMARDVQTATKAGVLPEAYGVKKGGPPSAVGYFQNRAEVALELVEKRSKLDRISNSGPGKLAKDIYMANSKDGKPFETTWQEIQLAFAGDPKGRDAAHEVALALDIINREEKAAPKQAPQ